MKVWETIAVRESCKHLQVYSTVIIKAQLLLNIVNLAKIKFPGTFA